MKLTAFLLLVLTLLFAVVSCDTKSTSDTTAAAADGASGIWANATYTEDVTLGEGVNTVIVTVEAEGKSIVLTIQTNEATLGEALYALGIINDPSFFDVCNGMKADWSKDQAYWGFYQGGTVLPYGVDNESATTAGNPSYEIIYTK